MGKFYEIAVLSLNWIVCLLMQKTLAQVIIKLKERTILIIKKQAVQASFTSKVDTDVLEYVYSQVLHNRKSGPLAIRIT